MSKDMTDDAIPPPQKKRSTGISMVLTQVLQVGLQVPQNAYENYKPTY